MLKQLNINIVNFWHAGTGRTSGSHVDRLIEKDSNNLPILNGRHIKGLLRDASSRAESWGWCDTMSINIPEGSTLTDWLFGTRNANDNSDDASRFDSSAGILSVSNATLPDEDIIELNLNPSLKPSLYQAIFSTAIDQDTGTAKEHSLRGIEVAIPMTLHAEVDCSDPQHESIFDFLNQIISLIDHVGGMRNRGLGRAQLSLEKLGGTHK